MSPSDHTKMIKGSLDSSHWGAVNGGIFIFLALIDS